MSSDIQTQKRGLRREISHALKQIPSSKKEDKEQRIWQLLSKTPEFVESKHILGYWSFGREVNTHSFLSKLLASKRISLPVIKGDKLVIKPFKGISDMKAEPKFGILEPQGVEINNLQDIDLVIVPGLGFDQNGGRLGRGKAYYDRLLPRLPNATTIGVCFTEQLVEAVPMDVHDKPLEKVIFA